MADLSLIPQASDAGWIATGSGFGVWLWKRVTNLIPRTRTLETKVETLERSHVRIEDSLDEIKDLIRDMKVDGVKEMSALHREIIDRLDRKTRG